MPSAGRGPRSGKAASLNDAEWAAIEEVASSNDLRADLLERLREAREKDRKSPDQQRPRASRRTGPSPSSDDGEHPELAAVAPQVTLRGECSCRLRIDYEIRVSAAIGGERGFEWRGGLY